MPQSNVPQLSISIILGISPQRTRKTSACEVVSPTDFSRDLWLRAGVGCGVWGFIYFQAHESKLVEVCQLIHIDLLTKRTCKNSRMALAYIRFFDENSRSQRRDKSPSLQRTDYRKNGDLSSLLS
ncbi:hypothetical protein [Nostoc sp. C117]|uniref:hypothetical protein n=1 Tax=Nostoc sp. C117 TaxID=3349875 RepID=UPI00370DD430